jgi:hypothetical protein
VPNPFVIVITGPFWQDHFGTPLESASVAQLEKFLRNVNLTFWRIYPKRFRIFGCR